MLRESHRMGIEPATCKSQVQRPTAEPPRNTESNNDFDTPGDDIINTHATMHGMAVITWKGQRSETQEHPMAQCTVGTLAT